MTLEIRSRSPKCNQLFPSSQQCTYASLVKIHPLAQKTTHRNPILDISSASVTLKFRSRSPKSELLFPSQQIIYASLVKNEHPLVQKITHGNHISDISRCRCDLEKGQGHQNLIHLFPLPNNLSMQVWSNPSTGSEDNAQEKSYADRIHTHNNVPLPSVERHNHKLVYFTSNSRLKVVTIKP